MYKAKFWDNSQILGLETRKDAVDELKETLLGWMNDDDGFSWSRTDGSQASPENLPDQCHVVTCDGEITDAFGIIREY